jgi:hypothetical protein
VLAANLLPLKGRAQHESRDFAGRKRQLKRLTLIKSLKNAEATFLNIFEADGIDVWNPDHVGTQGLNFGNLVKLAAKYPIPKRA